MKCPKCSSDNTIPSFTIPTWKCLDCGHIYPDLEFEKVNKSEILEEFAVKFNDVMMEFAIAGTVSAEDALHDLWDSWEANILPLLPFQSSTQTAKTEES